MKLPRHRQVSAAAADPSPRRLPPNQDVSLAVGSGRDLLQYSTPAVLRTDEGLAAVEAGPDEHLLGLFHFGPVRRESSVPTRAEPDTYVAYVD
jgi:hypothetical protein